MGFLPSITVRDALEKIHKRAWVLPAIQREFVWSTDQIRSLFDSLMRGYPVGSFLLWGLEPGKSDAFTFYDFLTDYHELKQPYAPKTTVTKDLGIVAVLDGQQRLTALNIGLRGSHAERLPRKWASNPDAYPTKRLYLNLLSERGDEDLGLQYDLRFLTDAEAAADGVQPWFKVADVLTLDDGGPAIMDVVTERGIVHNLPDLTKTASRVLYKLYEAIHVAAPVNAYQEESQDPDRVLDIFIRVNSGGTKLSNSDLLLSMATNQWKELDAREEVRSLVSELAEMPGEFSFSKDLILKSGLVLTEAADFGFKISNFTESNMHRLEESWMEIRASLIRAVRLLASFGLTGRTITADSVVIPVAYYLHKRELDEKYLTSSACAADRKKVQTWVFRSLLKRGIWGSGLDTLLRHIQNVLRGAPEEAGFPLAELESAMARYGKSLSFTPEEIDEILGLRYGNPRTFPVLAMLYQGLDLSQQLHEDHIFPRSRFTRSKLARASIPDNLIEEYIERLHTLPNLQLLHGMPNTEKGNRWPWEWLQGPHFTSDSARETYRAQNDLDLLPTSLDGFLLFHEQRHKRLAARLEKLLKPPAEES